MDIITKETVEIVIEILCGLVVIGLFSFVALGNQVIPILETLL